MKSVVQLSVVAGLAIALFGGRGSAQQPGPANDFVANEMLVQYEPGTTPQGKAVARGRVGATAIETVARGNGRGDLELVRIPPGRAVSEAVRDIQGNGVEFAEPNWIYTHGQVSNDPYYTNGSLWGMANQFGSGADQAWAAGHVGNDQVYVGIIDEGVMPHADLGANLWTNPEEIAGNHIDDDGNGFVDDVHGWDFDGNNATVYDGTQDDHGTHVAGTIGAVGGNFSGVAGVNWYVTMIPVKFLGRRGGTTANAVKAIDYLIDLKSRHQINLVATNNSWGGGGFSQSLLSAINRGGNAGILFVAAAGNGGNDGVGDNNDTTANYPSNYVCQSLSGDCVIAVAAITSSGARASFSNYGATTVDLAAPGAAIISTVPGKGGASSYASYSGTSMATPHVTGAAALYASTHPGVTAAEIKAAILAAAKPTPSMAGRSVTGGRLNVSGF
jgi:subtilisin family serine protease